eukprot:2851182-Ditylum_brightwellii.AAC.1
MGWDYATRNPQLNRIVFSQLSVATSAGTTYHIVKQYDNEKDGYVVWAALLEWHYGDVVKSETLDTIQSRLE